MRPDLSGHDPYNHDGLGRASSELLAAMEAAWQACLRSPAEQPNYIIVTDEFMWAWATFDMPPWYRGFERWWYQ